MFENLPPRDRCKCQSLQNWILTFEDLWFSWHECSVCIRSVATSWYRRIRMSLYFVYTSGNSGIISPVLLLYRILVFTAQVHTICSIQLIRNISSIDFKCLKTLWSNLYICLNFWLKASPAPPPSKICLQITQYAVSFRVTCRVTVDEIFLILYTTYSMYLCCKN